LLLEFPMVFRVFAVWLLAGSAFAASPPWLDASVAAAEEVDTVELPALDVAKARAEDYAGKALGDPPRIGIVAGLSGVAVGQGTADAGRWSQRTDGSLVWRLAVNGPHAIALDFAFSRFRLPAGAELWIRSPDGSDWIGPFTDADNALHKRFFTPMLMGSGAVLELVVPGDRREFVELELSGVNRVYRDLKTATLEKSGSCNIDVACPQGDPYREQIRSVAHYVFQSGSGSFVCTGQLMATTQAGNDATQPVFSTANHCVSTASEVQSMVFYWRYESASCRTPGSAASGQSLSRSISAATQSGASLLATHQPTDFTVVRLNQPVPAAAQAFWSGWDRSENIPGSSVSIHHPAGHEKRIAINTDPLTVTSSCIATTANNTHWRVNNWNQGTTEQGSSGAGLWRGDSKRLIGVLSGGDASCSEPAGFDCYGRLSTAWTGGGSAATRMRDWLDPANTGVVTHDAGSASGLQVSLSSPAFTTLARAGDSIVISAAVSGGSGPYSYAWDTNGDGIFERTTSAAQIELKYASRTSTQVTVRVTGAGGITGQTGRALDVRGPQLAATAAGNPVQVCGNNDGKIDPGELWQQPVSLSNSGNAAFDGGDGLFAVGAASSVSLSIGPNSFGYRGGRSQDGACSYGFIDIATGANAVAPLPVDDADDGRTVVTIGLGGTGFPIYGQRRTQAVMSTNGYVSFSSAETGAQWSNSCTTAFNNGAQGPQLRPLHDDLVVTANPGAGLRYRYFAACPRQPEADNATAQGCHVFQFSGMQRWGGGAIFEFQAIAYERSGQVAYQYRTADPFAGGQATIGIIDSAGIDPLHAGCNAAGSAPASSAICIYSPQALPGTSGPDALRLLQPVRSVPAIAAGASTTVNVPFSIDPGASCGAPFALDFVAAVDGRASSFQRGTVLNGSVGTGCQPVAGCPAQPPPQGSPTSVRQGLYFDPARDGNGLNTVLVPLAGGKTFFGGLWYTGERNYTPTWYQVAGEFAGGGGELSLQRFRNDAAPGGFSVSSTTVGRSWLGFTADGSILLAWDINGHGSGAERLSRLPQPFAQPNHTTAWYNPAQDGWGVAIESLNLGANNLEFVAAYMYDASGAPRWAVGNLPSVAGGTFPMLGFSPQCPGCPRYGDVQERTVPLGPLSIQYSGPTAAQLNSGLQFPANWSGSWNRSNLPIQSIVPPSGASPE
jgi:lysyl endopeptidase